MPPRRVHGSARDKHTAYVAHAEKSYAHNTCLRYHYERARLIHASVRVFPFYSKITSAVPCARVVSRDGYRAPLQSRASPRPTTRRGRVSPPPHRSGSRDREKNLKVPIARKSMSYAIRELYTLCVCSGVYRHLRVLSSSSCRTGDPQRPSAAAATVPIVIIAFSTSAKTFN